MLRGPIPLHRIAACDSPNMGARPAAARERLRYASPRECSMGLLAEGGEASGEFSLGVLVLGVLFKLRLGGCANEGGQADLALKRQRLRVRGQLTPCGEAPQQEHSLKFNKEVYIFLSHYCERLRSPQTVGSKRDRLFRSCEISRGEWARALASPRRLLLVLQAGHGRLLCITATWIRTGDTICTYFKIRNNKLVTTQERNIQGL